jgi:hypothetical protein
MGRGAEYVAEVAASGLVGGGGRYTALCAERLRERLGSPLVPAHAGGCPAQGRDVGLYPGHPGETGLLVSAAVRLYSR